MKTFSRSAAPSGHPERELRILKSSIRSATLAVWQLLHHRPGLLAYLALPTGYTVFLFKNRAERVINQDGDMRSCLTAFQPFLPVVFSGDFVSAGS